MLRRKIRDADDARACLAAVAESGLAQAAWAKAHGVDGRSLQAWRLVLERAGGNPVSKPLRLVELVTPTPPSAPLPSAATYVIRCGELAVEVDERFDETVLRRLLAVVASC
jgi:hypothetical protein